MTFRFLPLPERLCSYSLHSGAVRLLAGQEIVGQGCIPDSGQRQNTGGGGTLRGWMDSDQTLNRELSSLWGKGFSPLPIPAWRGCPGVLPASSHHPPRFTHNSGLWSSVAELASQQTPTSRPRFEMQPPVVDLLPLLTVDC